MSEVLAIFSVPPFLSDGFTMLVVPALKPDDVLAVPLVLLLFDEPPPPQADSARASAAEPAATAPIVDLTRSPPRTISVGIPVGSGADVRRE
jgi:hypothetical protein